MKRSDDLCTNIITMIMIAAAAAMTIPMSIITPTSTPMRATPIPTTMPIPTSMTTHIPTSTIICTATTTRTTIITMTVPAAAVAAAAAVSTLPWMSWLH